MEGQRNGKPESATVAELRTDPDLRRRDRPARWPTANKTVSKAEAIKKVRILADRLHRGDRRADPDDEAQAQRGHAEVRRRHRGAVREVAQYGVSNVSEAVPQQAPVEVLTHQLAAAGAHGDGAIGVGQQAGHGIGDRGHVAPVAPRGRIRPPTPSPARRPSRRPPRACRSRTPRGRRCRAPPRPGPRRGCGTAWRTRRPALWCAASSSAATPPVKITDSSTPVERASLCSVSAYGPPPDDHQLRARHLLADPR